MHCILGILHTTLPSPKQSSGQASHFPPSGMIRHRCCKTLPIVVSVPGSICADGPDRAISPMERFSLIEDREEESGYLSFLEESEKSLGRLSWLSTRYRLRRRRAELWTVQCILFHSLDYISPSGEHRGRDNQTLGLPRMDTYCSVGRFEP